MAQSTECLTPSGIQIIIFLLICFLGKAFARGSVVGGNVDKYLQRFFKIHFAVFIYSIFFQDPAQKKIVKYEAIIIVLILHESALGKICVHFSTGVLYSSTVTNTPLEVGFRVGFNERVDGPDDSFLVPASVCVTSCGLVLFVTTDAKWAWAIIQKYILFFIYFGKLEFKSHP